MGANMTAAAKKIVALLLTMLVIKISLLQCFRGK
jgi:hypothetical protein